MIAVLGGLSSRGKHFRHRESDQSAGDYGRSCGTFYTTNTSYPGGVAISRDGKSAYALLNQNNTLAVIDLTKTPLTQGTQIRVGNAPHSIVIKGTTAYISNEGGRAATQADFQIYSAGTPIVANDVNGSATTGTVSVVDLTKMQVKAALDRAQVESAND